jgi:glutamate synthase domain-containing protein 2
MIRVGGVACSAVLAAVLAYLTVIDSRSYLIPAAVVTVVALIGVYDLLQREHSLLRNYPVLGHLRFLLEAIRPEIQQYFVERNFDGRPFDRDVRSLIYQRAKGNAAEQSYGTERDLDYAGYEYLPHSVAPVDPARSRSECASVARTAHSLTTWR